MNPSKVQPLHPATIYHEDLPLRIRRYLNARGIPDHIIDRHLLGWNGRRITIPIFDRSGRLASFRLARDPLDRSGSPKMCSELGASAELYGWERVTPEAKWLVICEGEFDRLVLEGKGIPAVTSTGGVGTFKPDWAEALALVPRVFVCFDRDRAGENGARKISELLPEARIAELPEEVGRGGDVSDFFVRLGRGRDDFMRLLKTARSQPIPQSIAEPRPGKLPANSAADDAARAKSRVPIEEVVAQYVRLSGSRPRLRAKCPFHDDRHPSFTVFPGTQSFHCFGCGAHGDVITFLQRIEGLSFPEALEVLRKVTAAP